MQKLEILKSKKRGGVEKSRLIGAHTSIAGGLEKGVERAQQLGFTAAQIFVKSNHRWFAPDLSAEEVARFRSVYEASGIHLFAHSGYLINCGNPTSEGWAQSVKALRAELMRAEVLGLPFMVLHPGSHGGVGEEAGLRRIVAGLDEVWRGLEGARVKIALETTAGQGTSLGHRLEHLAWILQNVHDGERYGVCLDSAHLFAAGYELRTAEGYEATMRALEKNVGCRRVLAFHVNDSKAALGTRRDRHEHIGRGHLGREAFAHIMRDERWKRVPLVLETPKSADQHEDRLNIETLRELEKNS